MTKSELEKRYTGVGWDWYLETDEGSSWVSNMVKDHIERLESENNKLRELVEDMLSCIEIRAAWHRPPTEEMYENFAQCACELGIEVD